MQNLNETIKQHCTKPLKMQSHKQKTFENK